MFMLESYEDDMHGTGMITNEALNEFFHLTLISRWEEA